MQLHSQQIIQRTPAPRLRRLLAYAIDVLPISLTVYVTVNIVLHRAAAITPDHTAPGIQEDGSLHPLSLWISRMIIYLLWTSYSFVMDQTAWQGTFGKKLLGIKVVDMQGQRLGWKQSLIRNIGKWMGLPLVVLFLWFLFDRNRQSLHDKIAKTLVVEGK